MELDEPTLHEDQHGEATNPMNREQKKTVLQESDQDRHNRPHPLMSPRPPTCYGSHEGGGSSTQRNPSNPYVESQHAEWLDVAEDGRQERQAQQKDEDPFTGNQYSR